MTLLARSAPALPTVRLQDRSAVSALPWAETLKAIFLDLALRAHLPKPLQLWVVGQALACHARRYVARLLTGLHQLHQHFEWCGHRPATLSTCGLRRQPPAREI